MWSRTVVLGAALALAACRQPDASSTTPAPGAEHVAANTTTGLAVTTTTDRASVAAGERLRITITVANPGAAAHVLDFTSGCKTDYEFLDAANQVVGSSGQMCSQALEQRTLAPGESFSDTHVWVRGLVGMPELPPGRYRVRGVLLATNASLRSAPVEVTVP